MFCHIRCSSSQRSVLWFSVCRTAYQKRWSSRALAIPLLKYWFHASQPSGLEGGLGVKTKHINNISPSCIFLAHQVDYRFVVCFFNVVNDIIPCPATKHSITEFKLRTQATCVGSMVNDEACSWDIEQKYEAIWRYASLITTLGVVASVWNKCSFHEHFKYLISLLWK